MSFTLEPLPYAYDALQPFLSKESFEYHHDKHHQRLCDQRQHSHQGNGVRRQADRGHHRRLAWQERPALQQCRAAL